MARVRATYPFVRVTTATYAPLDSRLSYEFVAGPGAHETTVTRPNLFHAYLTEQIGLLIENHGVAVEIGESENRSRFTSLTGATSISKPASRCATRRRQNARSARSSTRPISRNGRRNRQWDAESAPLSLRRWPCSAPLESIIRFIGFTTTPAPIPSISRIS